METFIGYLTSLPTPFNFVCILGVIAIVCGLIYACYTAYLNNALKREMVNKGMSAQDIERVINAGTSDPENEDQPSEQGVASHAASQRP